MSESFVERVPRRFHIVVLPGVLLLVGCNGATGPAGASKAPARAVTDSGATVLPPPTDAGAIPQPSGTPEFPSDAAAESKGSFQTPTTDQTPLTESIVVVEELCLGVPECADSGCGCPPSSADSDGGCPTQPLPCALYRGRGSCEEHAGCYWGTERRVNEGTETGKRCAGEPLPCNVVRHQCSNGCVQETEPTERGPRPICVGTPDACSTITHAWACSGQIGCEWL